MRAEVQAVSGVVRRRDLDVGDAEVLLLDLEVRRFGMVQDISAEQVPKVDLLRGLGLTT